MSYETVLYEVADGVALITLNRPERLNAWNPQLARDLNDALTEADRDDAVRSVVLTGAGRAFCAGADLSAGPDTFDDDSNPERMNRDSNPRILPYDLRKPVIAAINGAAVGVGITYPLLADVRIVAEEAKIQFAFVRRGMLPELASHAILPRVVGFSNAADLLLTGRMISGTEAAALGLASAAVPADRVVAVAIERAREINLAAPVSVAAAKKLMWDNLRGDIAATTRVEVPVFAWFGQQPDAREGIVSFLEKRPPQWSMSPQRDFPEWPA
ncbi:MAG: enoyl-CoA hydratase-related protein [Acidimicrobiales bacterium]